MVSRNLEMQCKFCAAPLPKQGSICNYCNKLNPLNQQIIANKETKKCHSNHLCPCCHIGLETITDATVTLEYCSQCDGILIEEEEFEQLIAYNVTPLNMFNPYYLRFMQDHPRDNRKKAQFHNCPVCNEFMDIINYKKQSGILLDICEEHGIWIDGGELQQIVEWYEVGGNKKIEGNLWK